MSASTASLLRRAAAGAAVATCVAFPVSGFHWYSVSGPADQPVAAYSARFEGVAMDGIDLVWTGAVGGTINGDMTVRVQQLGTPSDAAAATWRVHAITFVGTDDPSRSFAADLDGTIDWTTHTIVLTGEVTEGYMMGARVEQRGVIKNDYNSVGSLRIAPALVAHRRPARSAMTHVAARHER